VKESTEKKSLKATVEFEGKVLSGRVLIKKPVSGDIRVAFYSELGMTYLEGFVNPDTRRKRLVIHSIIPLLDNKRFIRSFERSLRPELEK
jgi:hypothetical protein